MLSDVMSWVQKCEVCTRCMRETCGLPGLLQPLPILDQAWKHISMDFIEQLPKSAGKDTILVVICRDLQNTITSWRSHPCSTATVAKLFMDSIFKLHEPLKQ